VPLSLDFGSCPVQEKTEQVFTIRNVGGIRAEFSWAIPGAFSFSPSFGIIEPGLYYVPLSKKHTYTHSHTRTHTRKHTFFRFMNTFILYTYV
jgi:hypothetical protein